MSKKGLSLEDKKTKMLEIFHETKDFYQLKELEKIAPKSKGIVQQSVKEVLDDLKGDGLLDFDKIGTSNYFWSFPSAAGAIKQAKLEKDQAELGLLKTKYTELETSYADALRGREETAERTSLLTELKTLTQASSNLKAEIEAYGASDPLVMEQKRKAIEIAKEACVLWTDNAQILYKVFIEGSHHSEEEIKGAFNLGPDWDEVPGLP